MGTVVVRLEHLGRVLIGESGKYLQDTQKLEEGVQSLFGFPNTPEGAAAAAQEAARRAEALGAKGFTPLVWRPASDSKPDRYSTKFLGEGTTKGLIKGGIETGESAAEAAVREVKEETGFKLDLTRMQPTNSSTVFRVELTDAEAKAILASWKSLRATTGTELIALEWKLPSDLRPLQSLLNSETKAALGFGGRRKTRKRRFTRKRRGTSNVRLRVLL